MSEIPEYYRHLTEKPAARREPAKQPAPEAQQLDPPETPYRSDSFTINLYDGWQDKTVYVIAGPASDDMQHNITVNVDPDVQVESLNEYADWQVESLEENLKGCRLLMRDDVELEIGLPAHRAIFSWWPLEDLNIYQEQLYVLYDGKAFTLSASFSKKTRRIFGPQVLRMMLSFTPRAAT